MPGNDAYVFSLPLVPNLTTQGLLYGSLAVALLAIIIGIFFARRKALSKGRIILLLGNEDAGKTAILSTLIYDRTMPTHTSLQTNSSFLPSRSSKIVLELVDVPGHPRLRDSFKSHVPEAKAVVFVVDAGTITRRGPQVAEHLHHVLDAIASLPPSRSLPQLLILAHKSDLLSSSSTAQSPSERESLAISRVRTVLERELEKRRAVAAAGVGVEGLGAEGEGTELGGLDCHTPGGVFRFAEWEGGDVEFVASSADTTRTAGSAEKVDEEKRTDSFDGLDGLKIWLDELA